MVKAQILYSIYTGEFPNQFAGGPNNIIYKIIKNSLDEEYSYDYLSSDLFADNLNSGNLDELYNRLSPKKKTASILSEKSNIYRKFFGSDFYLPIHFWKKERYYKSFSNKVDKYDILHCQDSISLSLITDNSTQEKKIMTIHSKGPLSDELIQMFTNNKLQSNLDKRLKRIEKRSTELADLITFPSKAAKEYFENSLGIKLSTKKTKIIYNGIDVRRLQKIKDDGILNKYSIKKDNNQLLLLNIAGHVPEKNLDFLLKVISKIKFIFNKEICLINVGAEGNITQSLKKMVSNLGIDKNVKFLGKIPNDDVIKLIKATDMFVMTSGKVIFDLVVLEALACGACCVVSNDGGNREIIEDGVNGFLIDTNNIEGIAKKIISILPHKDKVKEKAIKTAQQFSVERMVNEYFELYESMLK